jgi:hypothetical protein
MPEERKLKNQEDLWPSIWARTPVELGENFRQLAGLDYKPLHEEKIGEIILKQMGGHRRIGAMLGARKFLLLPKGVAIGWPSRQRSKGNYVEITLRPDDTYDMIFFNVSPKYGKKKVKEYKMIYNDQLIPVFEKQTGYYLRL